MEVIVGCGKVRKALGGHLEDGRSGKLDGLCLNSQKKNNYILMSFPKHFFLTSSWFALRSGKSV